MHTQMQKKALNVISGIVLIPFCLGFTWQLVASITSVPFKVVVPFYFIAGGLTYLVVHNIFKKPILTYVFGHELTHALFAVLFGGSVKSFHASERGGRVSLTKSNVVITLAPYFFPLYTFAALVLYGLASAAEVRGAEGWLVFVAGATYAFHLALTYSFLQTDQNDIREHGAVFSYPLIYLFNIVFLAILIYLLLAERMDFFTFFGEGIIKSMHIMTFIFVKLFEAVQ